MPTLLLGVQADRCYQDATLYLSGMSSRRISSAAAVILDRVAGILLTSIAVVLVANGFTALVKAAW